MSTFLPLSSCLYCSQAKSKVWIWIRNVSYSHLQGGQKRGLRKGVPRVEHAKNREEESQQSPCDAVSTPSNKKGVRSQDQKLVLWEHDYFYTVCIFKIYSPFVLSHYLVKFILKTSTRLSGTKESSYIFVLRYTCEAWVRGESRIPGERIWRHYPSLQEASFPELSSAKTWRAPGLVLISDSSSFTVMHCKWLTKAWPSQSGVQGRGVTVYREFSSIELVCGGKHSGRRWVFWCLSPQ